MNKELDKQYNPADYEDAINKEWEASGFFNPDNLKLPENAPAYTIVLPPPNITDKLHVGHAVMVAVEDLLIRYKRMNGFRALWLPGTDHAAIATQNVVEKRLFKETGKTRHDLGREAFLAEVNKFAGVTQKTILNQIKKMGASLDWSRLAFTLDEQRGKAVKKMFIDMYNDGVIYRGERVINWCPRCQSTLADDEVEYKEQTAKLYTFKYSKDFPIAISTTRPETKLGDTAVAANPSDERYKKYIGQTFEVDFVGVPLKIKIIADRGVEKDFGTGALGVTPAHSMVDWQMAQKNELPLVKVIDEDAKIHPGFGEYSGLRALEAREKIVERLREAGLLEKEEDITNNLSQCYRCDTSVEPIPSKQWFVDVDKKLDRLGGESLKEVALAVATSGEIKFTPDRFRGQYENWMYNLHDWCVSRQIWYGHRIPAWYKKNSQIPNSKFQIPENEEVYVGENAPEDKTNFVFLHGSYQSVVGKDPLAWLNGKLNRPDNFWHVLPNIDQPDRLKQAEFVLKNAKINEDTVMVTHSRGGTLALKLIEEHDLKIKKLVLISPALKTPVKLGRKNYDNLVIDFAKVKKNVGEIVCFQPGIDHAVPLEDQEELARLLGARVIKVPEAASHFNELENQKILEELQKDIWTQDEDTLDTWFSSGMWTFSTLGWPDTYKDGIKSGDLAKFHPTAVLETGFEILTLWVSRMILMSYYALGEKPFSDVYLHGMILDDKGKKMSKSKGNGIDPLDVIAKYGTDSLRLALLIGSTPGNNSRMSWERIEAQRNFVNKLWNVSRYILSRAEGNFNRKVDVNNLTTADIWISYRINDAVAAITKDIESFSFSQAGEKLIDFVWNDLADWYLEASKFEDGENNKAILLEILRKVLKLAHPFAPFVTEVIWKKFNDSLLMVEPWPMLGTDELEVSNSFDLAKEVIMAIRNARAENKVEPAKKVEAVIYAGSDAKLIRENEILIKSLRTGISDLKILAKGEKIPNAIYATVGGIEIYLLGAVDAAKEKARLEKEIASLEKFAAALQGKLSNQEFIGKAPEKVVAVEKEKLAKAQIELDKLKEQLLALK
ncbi:MAG: class I tRNA ligase family protein [Patescibacteria group bacterium]|nr:class I tRNA ligase family protein [Patescibacteria group bacterium]